MGLTIKQMKNDTNLEWPKITSEKGKRNMLKYKKFLNIFFF